MCCLFRLIKVQVAKLTRNVNSEHLQEIFGLYGKVASAEVMMDPTVELSKGVAYVQFEAQADAEKAVAGLEGVTSPPPPHPSPQCSHHSRARNPLLPASRLQYVLSARLAEITVQNRWRRDHG